MKKYVLLLLSIVTVVVTSLVLPSCSEDPPPATNPKLSFAEEEIVVDEGDGTIEVELVLDKPAGEDIIVEYEIDGTAVEGSTAQSDYEILGDLGEVEISKGDVSAVIELDINPDNLYEGDETILLTIRDVNTTAIDITNKDDVEIIIEDDDVQSTVSFAVATLDAVETDGTISIEVKLDKISGQDVTIGYTLTGTARDSVTAVAANPDLPRDYAIRSSGGIATPGELVIEAGETTGIIRLGFYSDFALEDPESIIITISDATGGVLIGAQNVMEITLEQENGMFIVLEWGVVGDEYTYDDVDMDLFLWGEDANDQLILTNIGSLAASFNPPEFLFLPNVLGDGTYGFSYNYYEGTENPMNFQVTFAEFKNLDFEPEADYNVFTAAYTLANRNKWDQASGIDPLLAQTYVKTGQSFSAFSGITIPAAGSRVRTGELPASVVRQVEVTKPSNRVQRILRK